MFIDDEQQEGQGEGQEAGQESQAEGQTEGAQAATEGEQQPEQNDPNLYNEDGKPWKEVAKEFQRKYSGLVDKVATREVQPAQPKADDNEEIPATRGAVKQVLGELTREERLADQVFNEAMEDILAERPDFAPYRDELHGMVKTLNDVEARKNPDTIKVIAQGLLGRKMWKQQPATPKPVKKLVSTKQNDVLPPSPKGGASSTVDLTEAEQEYAEHHRFIGVFDNEEIKDMFKQAHKKKQGG